jgi:hypothetical protein
LLGYLSCNAALAQVATSPAIVRAYVEGPSGIPATGHGFASVRVRITDSSGKPLPAGVAVRAVILHGDARFASGSSSLDATTNSGSEVTLTLLPGAKAGPLVVRLDLPNATSQLDMALTAVTRKPLVVGFATGGIGPVPGWIEAPDSAPNGTNARRGTISIFGTGQISKNTVGTFAYDTADTLAQSLNAGPFLDNPNNRPFPIYGDTSIRYDDALSTNHMFARIDNGLSSAMWGEFSAQAAPSFAVGGYNVLVNGAKVHAEGNNVAVTAFTARNDIAYARTTITPTGLAIASQALQPNIVIGSDVLTLVQLDRRTGAVLSQQTLVPGSDYVLDYASGLLRFTNIILPYDDNFNPQVVMVQYEYGGPAANSTMLGGSGTLKFAGNARADAWYLNDSYGSGNLTVFGQSLGQAATTTQWSLSHEHSNGFQPGNAVQYGLNGDAYEAAFAVKTTHLTANLAYNNTSAGYDNPFGTYAAPGLSSFTGTVSVPASHIAELDLSYLYARNQLPATTLSEAVSNNDAEGSLILRVKPNARFSYHVGLQVDGASSNGVISPTLLFPGTQAPGTPNNFFSGGFMSPLLSPVLYQAGSGHSFDAVYGFEWKFAPHASFSVSRQSSLGGGSFDPYDPPQTQAEVDLDVGSTGKAFVRQLWQQTSVQPLAASQAAQSYAASASSSTSIGFQQTLGPATYESGYSVQHSANGTDLFDAMGVRETIISTPRLSLNGFLQLGQSLYSTYGPAIVGTSPYFVALGTSASYSEQTFHATAQIQVRGGFDSGTTFQIGAVGPISPSVSLFGTATGSYTSGVVDNDYNFGLSYRPALNDRYVTLLSLDSQRSNITNYDAYVTNVAQLQELYRPTTRLELAGSLGYKLAGDSYFVPHTLIYGLRADQRIGSRFDIASEYHVSSIAPLQGLSATGFAIEGGYRIGSTLRFAGGYNFSGFADPAASVNPTHRGVYLTLSTYIDRVGGWGKADQK